jgi:hypothetical protein
MRNHSYEIAKGNEVSPEFVGKTVTWQKAETIGEALGLPTDVAAQVSALIAGATKTTQNPHFESEKALVAAGEQQRDIAVREDIRSTLAKDAKTPGTIDAAAKVANELTIGSPRAGGKVGKAVKPQTIQKNAAASSGNKMFEKALVDEKFRNLMIRNGVLDEAEFGTWQAAREAASAPATTPAQQA